jgi:hypothetical protein
MVASSGLPIPPSDLLTCKTLQVGILSACLLTWGLGLYSQKEEGPIRVATQGMLGHCSQAPFLGKLWVPSLLKHSEAMK